jgi:enoyl-CoA hydratase/carnithine racemase
VTPQSKTPTTVLLSEDAGPVRLLTLNRPHARNALSGELIGALKTALINADDDTSVRASHQPKSPADCR